MITYQELECEVEFGYTPECKGSRNGYGVPMGPDSPAEIEITSVIWRGIELIDKLTEDELKSIKSEVWDCIQQSRQEDLIEQTIDLIEQTMMNRYEL